MLKDDDKKLVLDYLYKQSLVKIHAKYSIKKKGTAKIKQKAVKMAKKELKNMNDEELIKLFKIISFKEVEKYLRHSMKHSLVFDWVNGSPEKRDIRICEWAHIKISSMTEDELISLYKKLGMTYFPKN